MESSKAILITGASRGIGLLTAKELIDRGHTVFAGMRDIDGRNGVAATALDDYASRQKGTVTSVELDVTDDTSVQEAVDRIERLRPIDVLINNAGVMPVGLTEGFTLQQAKDLFDVNVYGIMRMSRAVLPAMRRRKSGLLISLSSAAGRFGMPYFGLYCSSKWAMEAYCEALHYELEPFGIESLLVEPSGHGTDLVDTAPAPADADTVGQYGPLAEGRDRLLGMFQSMFRQQEDLTDARNVAVAIAGLVDEPAPRPIRTQVGHDMGVSAVNEAVAPIQAELMNMLKPIYSGAAT